MKHWLTWTWLLVFLLGDHHKEHPSPACSHSLLHTVKLYVLYERSRWAFHYAVLGSLDHSRVLPCPSLFGIFFSFFFFAHGMKLDIVCIRPRYWPSLHAFSINLDNFFFGFKYCAPNLPPCILFYPLALRCCLQLWQCKHIYTSHVEPLGRATLMRKQEAEVGGALRHQQCHNKEQNFHLSARYHTQTGERGKRKWQEQTLMQVWIIYLWQLCKSRGKWAGLVLLRSCAYRNFLINEPDN